MLLMIYASWCPHCHKMQNEIFPDADVSAFLKQNFHVAAQDAETVDGRKVAHSFNVHSYPAFVIVDYSGNLLYGFGGELKKGDFLEELRNAVNPERQLPYLEKAFANAPDDGNRCLALILALRKANRPTAAAALAYLNTQAEASLVSALNWKIIANGVTDIESREFRYVLDHQREFASVSSAKRVERKIENIVSETLRPLAERSDLNAYNDKRRVITALRLRKADSLLYVYDKQAYEKAKDWSAYQSATLTATREFAWNQYAVLRSTATVYLSHITEQHALAEAVKWSKRSTELQESKEGYLLTARLYEKSRDRKNALEAATSARDFCVRVGFGTKEADDILNRLAAK